jgi:hypothetical protein
MDVDVAEGRLLATFWTVVEVDQLQAEATRRVGRWSKIMAADPFMDWEVSKLLDREPPDYLH